MKKFLSVVFSFFWLISFAQLDTDHWFAPVASTSANVGPESHLHLSTNETVPFTVSIYNNNQLYTTAVVSKGNPQQIYIPPAYMFASAQSQMFTPVNKGLNVKGPKKFFANYRFAVPNHAEIITSKGLAGLGTTFYAAMAPLTGSGYYIGSTIGVVATEDNTTVTVSGYDPFVVFSDGTSSPTKTFTLNKGQSYIIETVSTSSPSNMSGLIGAKIEANHPVSVTNGNFNGIYALLNTTNNDILMDQAVPVNRLGNNFVLVKGNAPAISGMEQALIVATENNTQVTVNGTPTGITLNEGEYTMIDGTSYIHQGNDHYNMSIQTSQNAYVYQLLGGTPTGVVFASGGFNYIPPLSCFLPNQVDEIGDINILGNNTYATKLNILTETGAAVTVNGATPAPLNGPFPVTGNPQWVSYSIPNVTGNVTINSNKSVTAGIAAGSGAVGYGGYFAGFSSVPAIAKTGDCYSGILLQVDSTYDSYQWYLNGVPIGGATSNTINPELYGAGSYTVLITKNNCESKLTEPYVYTLCPPITTSTYNIGSCNSITINPAFTNPTQPINPALTQIIAAPASGTAAVNPATGAVTYTPSNTLAADTQVQFVYYIEGTGNPATFEYFRVYVNVDVLQTANASITACSDANGNGTFDLTSVSLTPDSGTTIEYFTNANLTGPIANPAAYSGPTGIVYAEVTSEYGCAKPAQIQLTVYPSPNLNTANYDSEICDENFDGIININFAAVTPQIVNNAAQFNVQYYLNQADALAGNANTLPANWNYTTATTVFVRVDAINGNCPPVFGQIDFSIGNQIQLISSNVTVTVCDPDGNGSESVTLTNYVGSFTADPTVTASFHNTLADAQNDENPVNVTQTVNGASVYYIRFESPSACPATAEMSFALTSINVTPAALSSCGNAAGTATFNLTTANVTTSTGVTVNYFQDAALTVPIANPATYIAGNSTVYAQVSSGPNCSATTQITLTVIPMPTINATGFNGVMCDDNFDGVVHVDFHTVSTQIINPLAGMQIRYYLNNADALAGNNNFLPINWSFTATTTVYIRVQSLTGNCPPVFGQIVFSIGNKLQLISQNVTTEVCDNDLNGTEQVNLHSLVNLFTANAGATASFHNTLADAQNAVNTVALNQNITGTHVFYVRITAPGICPNTVELTVTLKQPKESQTLADVTICPGTQTILDAGPDFTSYLWSNGETTQSINVGVGTYYVDLGFNGCVYRQFVHVLAAEDPVITKIEVKGDVATIHVTGGTPPYQYSLDGLNWQSSNVFMGLSKGVHKVFVTSKENCRPIIKEFLVLDLINAITPNGDGINDVLDYSDLRSKKNVTIEVYDRYGASVFRNSSKNYVWDGKIAGQSATSGTYWYLIKWTDPDSGELFEYSGWLLIKNRD